MKNIICQSSFWLFKIIAQWYLGLILMHIFVYASSDFIRMKGIYERARYDCNVHARRNAIPLKSATDRFLNPFARIKSDKIQKV